MVSLRSEVLKCFKKLHRARTIIFDGDEHALGLARNQINSEFRKNIDVSDPAKVDELIKTGLAVENELRTTVIQAREVKPGVYEAKITPDTLRLDNVPFNDNFTDDTDTKVCCSKPKKCGDK